MKFFIFSFFLFVLSSLCLAQPNPNPCPYDNSPDTNPTFVGGASVGQSINGIKWSGWTKTLVGMESNKSYLITLCISQLHPSFDNQITIYPHGGGQAVAWNDDSNCPADPTNPELIFTPPNNGDYDLLFDEYWNDYCQHYNDGLNDDFNYYMEVLSVNPPASIQEDLKFNKKLVKILNVFGQETSIKTNTLLFYIYNDGSVKKRINTK